MSFFRNPAAAVDSPANGHLDHRHSSSKRKFDDFAPTLDDEDEDDSHLVPIRMKKDDHHHHHHHSNHPHSAVYYGASSSSSSIVGSRRYSSDAPSSSAAGSSPRLQFFIRMLSAGNTLVIYANSEDTVESLHQRIEAIAGIRATEQRLIYNGKQLQLEQSLAECSIENDANLQLVGRMRSTGHPQTWQVMDTMISHIRSLFRGESGPVRNELEKCIPMFFEATPKEDNDSAPGHFQVFLASSAPAFLVRLFMSSNREDKKSATSCIGQFMDSCKKSLPESMFRYCSPIVLEFCKLLREVDREDDLYVKCRSTLGWLMESVDASRGLKFGEEVRGLIVMQEIFPFVGELADKLCMGLESSLESPTSLSTLTSDVRDFIMFLNCLRCSIEEHVGSQIPIRLQSHKEGYNHPVEGEEINFLHDLYVNMLSKMDKCLVKVEERFTANGNLENESVNSGWSQYLVILRELHRISELYLDDEEWFWKVLKHRKSSLCALIVRFARRTDDYQWLLQHKDVTDFESRRHLTMLMFPEVKEDYEELHEMLIDRSQLLAESFEYIGHAERDQLHSGLFMEFKTEEATGPGVLREWFFLVCQAIFNPENALFVACPNDRRRFFPNPASKVDPLHLEYFNFAGRIIALALMHKVQVGIVFDRVFFLQLAGKRISLEDIRDADPCLYSSCKQILEMDPEFIDSDALGLTFVREVDELGYRRIVELCPGGKCIIVNSRNRQEYVDLLIQHRFVTSISEQVLHFAQGFSIILQNEKLQKFFFQSLELEELDWMLYGSESAISVEDWKAHTDYNGFRDDDPQITWFWKIVDAMTADQKKILLFFWTSVKYLPVEGFRGLASRLYIFKSSEPHQHLPSSHTCFYRLCFPPYPSMAVMQDRFRVITQEHVGCSFGTW